MSRALTLEACEIVGYAWPLRGAQNAQRAWTTREGLVVRLRAGGGLVGYGEAAPLPGFSRDDLGLAERALASTWRSCGPVDTEASVARVLAPAAAALASSPAAAFALETALLDLVGHARNAPAWRLARKGDDAPAPIPVSALLTATDEAELAAQARAAQARGLRVGKVKVLGPEAATRARDAARIRAVLDATAGAAFALRLDANQSLGLDALPGWLADVAPRALEVFEEPFALGDWARAPALPFRLGMDESLADVGAEARVDACAARAQPLALVLKPMALGGWARAHALADLAARRGAWVYTTHMFDGPIAAAAAADLALSLAGHVAACGLDAFARADDWPAPGPAQITASHLVPHGGPGLGVSAIGEALFAAFGPGRTL